MKVFATRANFLAVATVGRSAGFPTCRIADFQIGGACGVVLSAGLETRDTADLEVCATLVAALPRCVFRGLNWGILVKAVNG